MRSAGKDTRVRVKSGLSINSRTQEQKDRDRAPGKLKKLMEKRKFRESLQDWQLDFAEELFKKIERGEEISPGEQDYCITLTGEKQSLF